MSEATPLATAVSAGVTLSGLEAVRDRIAEDLDVCAQMRDRAALYARLVDVLARIDEMRPQAAVGDFVDEIAERRSARRAAPTKSSPRASRAAK